MELFGQIISIVVAVSWTVTAVLAEIASKRLGATELNVIRMALSLVLLALLLVFTTGSPVGQFLNIPAFLFLASSGLVGYTFGDYCLFNSYLLVGSRFGQLLMTLSSVFAAFSCLILLGEEMRPMAWVGMFVTLGGISMSIMGREEKQGGGRKISMKLPVKGVLLGLGAAAGQGCGLVLSKMGMVHYGYSLDQAAMSGSQETIETVRSMVPFAATQVRAMAGLVSFAAIMILQGKVSSFKKGLNDRKGMLISFVMTIFGPFVGVSLSLMAVQYCEAGIASTIMATTPILILVPAYFVFHQKITRWEIVGATVSIIGVSLFFI